MQGVFYYSTISGNTRLVGGALQGIFANAGITLTLQDVAEDTTWQDEVDFAIFGSGTYAHGMIEKSLRKCVEEIWKEKRYEFLVLLSASAITATTGNTICTPLTNSRTGSTSMAEVSSRQLCA